MLWGWHGTPVLLAVIRVEVGFAFRFFFSSDPYRAEIMILASPFRAVIGHFVLFLFIAFRLVSGFSFHFRAVQSSLGSLANYLCLLFLLSTASDSLSFCPLLRLRVSSSRALVSSQFSFPVLLRFTPCHLP